MDSDAPELRAHHSAIQFFWISLSLSLLAVAMSTVYFLLVYVPKRDAARDQLSIESRRQEAETRATLDCANQAARAVSRFVQEDRMSSRVFGIHQNVTGTTNHFNRRLSKCFVQIETMNPPDLSGFSIVDAYENTEVLDCLTKIGRDTRCWSADENSVDPKEADARKESLMSR